MDEPERNGGVFCRETRNQTGLLRQTWNEMAIDLFRCITRKDGNCVLDTSLSGHILTASRVVDRTIMPKAVRQGVRVSVGVEFLVLKHVHTGHGAHSASASMGSRVPSGGKAASA